MDLKVVASVWTPDHRMLKISYGLLLGGMDAEPLSKTQSEHALARNLQ